MKKKPAAKPDMTEQELKSQTKEKGRPTETELRHQTLKWLPKLEKEFRSVRPTGKLPKKEFDSLVRNMNAYVSDAHHFLDMKDYVRAFEAVIYAWGIYETAQRVGIIAK